MPVVGGLCSFEGPRGRGLEQFPVAIARGKHLFPFRTEQLSPAAPMVLGTHVPGRVGRRRFLPTSRPLGGSSSSSWAPSPASRTSHGRLRDLARLAATCATSHAAGASLR